MRSPACESAGWWLRPRSSPSSGACTTTPRSLLERSTTVSPGLRWRRRGVMGCSPVLAASCGPTTPWSNDGSRGGRPCRTYLPRPAPSPSSNTPTPSDRLRSSSASGTDTACCWCRAITSRWTAIFGSASAAIRNCCCPRWIASARCWTASTHPARRAQRMRADLVLVGFGNVGRRFARLRGERDAVLRREHDLELRIVGIATQRHGSLFAAAGLDGGALAESRDRDGPLSDSSAQPCSGVEELIARLAASSAPLRVIVETTPLAIADGQPAIGHIEAALDAGCDAITANK